MIEKYFVLNRQSLKKLCLKKRSHSFISQIINSWVKFPTYELNIFTVKFDLAHSQSQKNVYSRFLLLKIICSKIIEYEYLEILIKQNNKIGRKDNFKVILFLEDNEYKTARKSLMATYTYFWVLETFWLDFTHIKMIWLASQNFYSKISNSWVKQKFDCASPFGLLKTFLKIFLFNFLPVPNK